MRVLTGHLTDDGVEVGLILGVDESVMKYALAFMAEDLGLVSYLTWLTLQYAW